MEKLTVNKLTQWIAIVASFLLLQEAAVGVEDQPIMVDVGGHKLHLHCQGSGSPTLLLDSGLGGTHLDWSLVQPALSQSTRVCSYDRAGYGISELGPMPRDAQHLASDLNALLTGQHLPSPVVLVGHSLAGFHLRLVAQQQPERVAGLVLIESAHEDQFELFQQRANLRLAPNKGDRIRLSPPAVPTQLPPSQRKIAQSYANEQKSLLTLRSELSHFTASAKFLQKRTPDLEQPLLVISRGQTQWKNSKDAELRESIWQELQSELSQLNKRSIHIIASQSGHFVHLEQPRLVVNALTGFADGLRSASTEPQRQALLFQPGSCSPIQKQVWQCSVETETAALQADH